MDDTTRYTPFSKRYIRDMTNAQKRALADRILADENLTGWLPEHVRRDLGRTDQPLAVAYALVEVLEFEDQQQEEALRAARFRTEHALRGIGLAKPAASSRRRVNNPGSAARRHRGQSPNANVESKDSPKGKSGAMSKAERKAMARGM